MKLVFSWWIPLQVSYWEIPGSKRGRRSPVKGPLLSPLPSPSAHSPSRNLDSLRVKQALVVIEDCKVHGLETVGLQLSISIFLSPLAPYNLQLRCFGAVTRTNNKLKLNPHYGVNVWNRTWATLMRGERSHYSANPAPTKKKKIFDT